ncbi:MAG TPA: ATP-dependent RecD-like DNA helicase [Azoarcus taiwanensis]|nr:ATP-dependent RecD-like DNA helicase [Azoarcus taiwanensis]
MASSAQIELQSFSGSVERIVNRNESTGWAVLEVSSENGPATLVGSLAFVDEGLQIQAEGTWAQHPTFGRQFRVSAARVFAPVGVVGIERFLRSGAVKGIGPVFAKKIVERFGDRTLEIIQGERWRLKYLKGVGPKRIEAVVQGIIEYSDRMEVMSFLHGQLGPVRAQRVFEKYGKAARDKIAENPYRLIKDFDGIGFLLADRVARDVGIGLDATKRLQAGVMAVLQDAAGQGHTCVPKDGVRERLVKLLDSAALADQALLVRVDGCGWHEVECGGVAYLELDKYRHHDERVAELLVELAGSVCRVASIDGAKAVPWVEKVIGIEFETGQAAAISIVLEQKVSSIVGGPGTGKSTILNGLLKILAVKNIKVALAAPTGRAARRMTECTGQQAETIHRLLEYNPQAGGFQRKKDCPLEADVVIVDEASMMDIGLTRALLEAVAPETKLVLVGDADQLPSVGPGNVLSDVIESGAVTVARLTKPYRQAATSPIIRNAHMINAGIAPELEEGLDGFEFIATENKEATAATLVELICQQLPAEGVDPVRDLMLLSPMNKGVVGIEQMNEILQQRLNPHPSDQMERGGRTYRVGDRVIQTKNNRDLGVYNGDVGMIEGIDRDAKTVRVQFDTGLVNYPFGDLYSLALAYCLTVHRAQGSEYPCIVAAVDMSNSIMLTRKLLYTAVTRAKQRVILVGQKRAVHIAVSEARAFRRHTLLAPRIKRARQQRLTA